MAISYKNLGLVNSKEMFAKAVKGGYAIPAFNFNNMEQLQAIIKACVETNSPVILQVSKGLVNMRIRHYSVTWLKGQFSMQKRSATVLAFQLYCIWIMATVSKPAKTASTWGSPR